MDVEFIENLRKLKKLSQKDFAESIDMSTFGYQKMIKVGDGKASTLKKISKLYSVGIDQLFGVTDSETRIVAEPRAEYKKLSTKEDPCAELRGELEFFKKAHSVHLDTIDSLNKMINLQEQLKTPVKSKQNKT